MATLGTNAFTMADIAKRMDPGMDKVARVVEVLHEQNDILKVLPFMEGNLPTGNRVTVRSKLPAVGTRQINKGVKPSYSGTKQVDDATMLLEAYSNLDTEQVRLGGNVAQLRASEDAGQLEAMNQEFNQTLFYGNEAQDETRFNGLSVRYGSTSGEHGDRILDAGGTGADNASIWLVGLGDSGLHGIYPKGTSAGVERTDLGEQLIAKNGKQFTALVTKFAWHCGISVKDFRQVIRIANIDTPALSTFGGDADTSAKLLRLMIEAMNRRGGAGTSGGSLKYAFLMNETAKTWADIMTTEKANGAFNSKEIHGMEFTTFRNIPCLQCDALTDAESRVV
jgi:hypothetical protein